MKKNILNLAGALAAALLSVAVTGCSNNTTWVTDLEEAKVQAKAKNKNIYLLFSGDDWVPESKTFKDNVANTEKFTKAMSKDYILCNLDFSQEEYSKTDIGEDATDEEKAEAARIIAEYEIKDQLGQKYAIRSWPMAFLLTKEEYVITAIGYNEELNTPESYLESLKMYDDQVKLVNDTVKKINGSQGVSKAQAIDELYNAMSGENNGYVSPWLDDLIAEYPSLDPENTTGNVGRYQMDGAYAEAIRRANRGEVDTAPLPFIEVASTSNFLSDLDKQTCYYTAAFVLAQLQSENYDLMLEYLEKAYNIDTESEITDYLLEAIEGVKQMKAMFEMSMNMEFIDDENLYMQLGEGETSE